jgi:glutathione S-transferase
VVLYTCPDGKAFGSMPGPLAHPCGRAAVALDKAGHTYEWRKVKGGTLKFWTWSRRAQDRADVERLSGQRSVPILVLDDGDVITGSGAIAKWARRNAPVVSPG